MHTCINWLIRRKHPKHGNTRSDAHLPGCSQVDDSVNPLQLCEGDEEGLDEDEKAALDRWLDVPLGNLPVSLGPGVVFKVCENITPC